MAFELSEERQQVLIKILGEWKDKKSYRLVDAAQLNGMLESASQAYRWARPYFFAVQNTLCDDINSQYHKVKGLVDRGKIRDQLIQDFPASLYKRIQPIVDAKTARLVYQSNTQMKTNDFTNRSINYLHDYLANQTNPWMMYIGHAINREPTFTTLGDACKKSGNGYCHELEFLYDIHFSPGILRRVNLSSRHIHSIHINCLEYVMILLQIAAVIERLDDLPTHIATKYDVALNAFPVLLSRTDNTNAECWTAKVTAKTSKSQPLVEILAGLLKT
jgi:hypothetical protein